MTAIYQLELCVTLTVRQILINSLFSLCYIIYNDFLWKSNYYIANLTLTVNELCPSTACGRIGRVLYCTHLLFFKIVSFLNVYKPYE